MAAVAPVVGGLGTRGSSGPVRERRRGDSLDLSAIEDTYEEERGYSPYHPRMVVKVLLYGYCTGVYSSRKMACQLEDSVAFRFLAAGNQPEEVVRWTP